MNTKRVFASLCLAASSCALFTAASVSVGDQPGVVRLTASQQGAQPPVPAPPVREFPDGASGAALGGPPSDAGTASMAALPHSAGPVPVQGYPMQGMPMDSGFATPSTYDPYFESSGGVTEAPVLGRMAAPSNPLFGPSVTFESNFKDGLGFSSAYHRANVRVPYHVVPGSSVLMADMSTSITNQGNYVYNFGAIWRNYDASRNRIFGWNAYFDMDDGQGNTDWKRFGFGMESLGKYLDFRANGYVVTGNDSFLLSDSPVGDLQLSGSNVYRIRNQTRENAYSGVDAETGGPLPYLGRRGINGYVGGYYLDNDTGFSTVGVSARVEALITESVTANFRYTQDDTFGSNGWVSVAYQIPNYRERTIFQPKSVHSRLADPVYRNTRIHTNIDEVNTPELVLNEKTGNNYRIAWVDPNSDDDGVGTMEDPYGSLQLFAANNDPSYDVIRVVPNADDSGSDLTVNGGLQLFDFQQLISSVSDFNLFTDDTGMDFIIPGEATPTNLGPLVTNPTNGPGSSVIYLANCNTVSGLRIDGSNAAGTAFGNGISNPLPFQETRILNNTFTNYVTAMNLQNVSEDIRVEGNTVTGLAGTSQNGLVITTGNNSETNLLVSENTVTNNGTVGISVTVAQDAILNADNTTGFNGTGNPAIQPTGIVNNTVTDGGEGIAVVTMSGSTANLIVDENISSNNSTNGLRIVSDDATVNLASMSTNQFLQNGAIGAFLHYRNGGLFNAITEDINEDTNFNGTLDALEDLNGDGLLTVFDNTLGTTEDRNNNGQLDLGITGNTFSSNDVGLCIFGEGAGTGLFTIGGPVESYGNVAQLNDSAGVAIDLNGTAEGSILSMFNRVQESAFDRMVATTVDARFDIGGNAGDTVFDTQSAVHNLTNNSATADIVGFSWNLDLPAGTADWEFDTTAGTALASIGNPFTPQGTSADDTGLDIVNGVSVPLFDDSNGLQTTLDSSQLLTMSFTDDESGTDGFDFGETLSFVIDSDQNLAVNDTTPDDVVTAAQLAGTEVSVTLRDDFFGNGTQVQRTFTGNATVSADNAEGLEFVVNETVEAAVFSTDPTKLGEGIRVNLEDASRLTQFRSINDTSINNKGNGLTLTANGSSRIEELTVQGGTFTGNQGRGLNVSAQGSSFIAANQTIGGYDTATNGQNLLMGSSFAEGNTFSQNVGGGARFHAADSGEIRGNFIGNQVVENQGNGLELAIERGGTLEFGTAANSEVITRNNIAGNSGVGVQLTSEVEAGNTGVLNALLTNNSVIRNEQGGITASAVGSSDNNTLNLNVGGTSSEANTIANNSGVGVGFNVAGRAQGDFSMTNSTVTNTLAIAGEAGSGDGIRIRRADSSLLTATIDNVISSQNAGDGLDVETQGNNKTDPVQPLTGTVNTVSWENSNFSNNGENGARFRTRGDSQLVADGTANVVANNGQSGILVQTSENSEFGDTTGALLPPGRRVVFDGTTATGNGQDGLTILTGDESRAMMEITSNRVVGSTSAHAGLNTNGDSSFSDNGRDGIHIETEGSGSSDILITSDTGQTRLNNNGTQLDDDGNNIGGNGLRWDARETSEATVRIEATEIVGNIAGATEDAALLGNGLLDPGEDINGNGILDTNLTATGLPGIGGEDGTNDDLDTDNGDGIQFNVFNRAIPTLVVGGIGRGNVIQGNGDDGIAITATGSNLYSGTPAVVTTSPNSPTEVDPTRLTNIDISRPSISIVENVIGGERDGIQAGNGGDGVSVNVLGGTIGGEAFGIDPATNITTGPAVSLSTGVTQSGPIMQFTMQDNLVSNNGRRGINLLVTGAAGERDRENGNADFDPGRFTLSNNTVVSNGTEGIFYRGDAEMNQSRVTYLANFPDTIFPGNDRTRSFGAYNPNLPQYQGDNIGSLAGQSAFASVAPDGEAAFLNLRTVQNTFLTVENNTVQKNGVGGVTGEGIVLSVGTGSYLAADVRDNIFGGNLEEDVRTESFLSFGETFQSEDNSGDLTYDAIYHDDSAQMDLRFFGNTGNQIALSSDGATYTAFDSLKSIVLDSIPTNEFGVTDRNAAFFQVDNGLNLNTLGNDFINFGITQQMNTTFQDAGFNLRNAADAAYPNLLFAPFLP